MRKYLNSNMRKLHLAYLYQNKNESMTELANIESLYDLINQLNITPSTLQTINCCTFTFVQCFGIKTNKQ
jgi:hypothetical protein